VSEVQADDALHGGSGMTDPRSLRLELQLSPHEVSTAAQLEALADLAHETRQGVIHLLTLMAEMEVALRGMAAKERAK
jgi:hypothetical protein